MKIKYALFLFLISSFSLNSFGQLNKSLMFNSWKAIKYKEADGSQFTPPTDMKNDYLKLNSDKTYSSLESGKLLIKGFWTFDEKTNEITLNQHQTKKYPSNIKLKIVKLNKNEFVVEGYDIENSQLTIFMIPKN